MEIKREFGFLLAGLACLGMLVVIVWAISLLGG